MKLIFIDIDNTLLDFDAYVKQTLEKGFERFNLIKYTPEVYTTFTHENNKLWHRIEDGSLTFQELEKIRFNIIFKALGITFDGPVFEKYFRSQLYDCAIPVEGSLELLRRLSKDYILAAASNGPYDQQLHRLDISGMKEFFPYIFISEKAGASKPDKAFFDYAFDVINQNADSSIDPAECLIIGDSLTSDMEGGRRYGMKTCFYMRKPMDLSDHKLDAIVTSLDEISADLIENLW